MPWTTPSTVNAGDAILASLWNEQVRDNMASLVEAGTTLPSSPVDGQSFYYVADTGTGTVWHLRYRAASTKWEFVGGNPYNVQQLGAHTAIVANNTWTDTSTGSLTYTTPVAGIWRVDVSASLLCSVAGTLYLGVARGATNPTASTNTTIATVAANGVNGHSLSYVTPSVAASTALTVKYLQVTGGSATIDRRGGSMKVYPVQLG